MTIIVDSRGWVTRARCYDRNPRLYETDGHRNNWVPQPERVARARDLCAGCPVVRDCAADAIEPLAVATIRGGVWIEPNRDRRASKDRLRAVALGKSVEPRGA